MTHKSRKTGFNWWRKQLIFQGKLKASVRRQQEKRDERAWRKKQRSVAGGASGDSAPVTERKRRKNIPRFRNKPRERNGNEEPKRKMRFPSSIGGKFKLGGSKK